MRTTDTLWHAGHFGGGAWVLMIAATRGAVFGRAYRALAFVAGSVFLLHAFAFPIAPWWFGLEFLLVPIWAAWTAVAIARSAVFASPLASASTARRVHWYRAGPAEGPMSLIRTFVLSSLLVATACGQSAHHSGGQAGTGAGGASSGGNTAASGGASGASGTGAAAGVSAGGTGGGGGAITAGASGGGAAGTGGTATGGAGGTATGGAGGTGTGGAATGGSAGSCALGGSGPGSGVLGNSIGSLELYGTFHAMGVIATIPTGSDANTNAVAHVEYRVTGTTAYRQGFPLTRVGANRFVGSLFWLTPGTSYDARVWYTDVDGAPLDTGWAMTTASTRAEISLPTPVRVLHVAPAGTGTACSVATPCAVSQAITQAMAGDEVNFAAGTYNVGQFTLPRSGTATAPIVFRGTGLTTVLDGADPAAFTWTAQGGGVFSTTVTAADPHVVTADDVELFPYTSAADLSTLGTHGTPGFFASGTSLSVHLAAGVNPSTVQMRVSRYNDAFYVGQSNIAFVDLTFKRYGQGSDAKAIYLRDGSDVLIQGCHFLSNDVGVGIKGAASRNVIQDSEFANTSFDWYWEDVKAEGRIEPGGVVFYDPVDGRGNVIRRNVFHDSFDGFGACPGTSAATTNETDVYLNTGYNLGDDGMETDGRCANVRIWSNTFHDTLAGVSLAPVYDGPVYAIRNVISRLGAGNSDAGYTGIPFKLNSGSAASGTIYLFHNTVDASFRPNNSGFKLLSPGSWQLIYARNNVWAGSDYGFYNSNPTEPLDFDYDALWAPEAGWWSNLADRHLETLAEFILRTGLETNGLFAAPAFTNATGANFTPSSSSPLVDKGVVLPGINDDFTGCRPDIGAIERP